MNDDLNLLRDMPEQFRGGVRHARFCGTSNLVYSMALRQVRDAHLRRKSRRRCSSFWRAGGFAGRQTILARLALPHGAIRERQRTDHSRRRHAANRRLSCNRKLIVAQAFQPASEADAEMWNEIFSAARRRNGETRRRTTTRWCCDFLKTKFRGVAQLWARARTRAKCA